MAREGLYFALEWLCMAYKANTEIVTFWRLLHHQVIGRKLRHRSVRQAAAPYWAEI